VKLLLRSGDFRQVLREWVRQIENGSGSEFASWFMKILSDRSHRLNEACCRFAPFMRTYSWSEVRSGMPKGLRTRGTFDRPNAERFYMTFKKSLVSRIDRYWKEFSQGAGE
jgi:hypothetical protein